MELCLSMASPQVTQEPLLPFPISRISSTVERYFLYDVELVTWLRKAHSILGVLVGTLPQFPQQNVFLGLPLELQSEEARFLVEEHLAYVVDDFEWHNHAIRSMTSGQRQTLMANLRRDGREAAMLADKKKDSSREKITKQLQDENRIPREKMAGTADTEKVLDSKIEEESLFNPLPESIEHGTRSSTSMLSTSKQKSWAITPPTSHIPFHDQTLNEQSRLPSVHTPSYALFKHLHHLSYFLSPGLRFGCQFLVYPGDPLRFHSHFLAISAGWDEEIDLLDLVAGGRLGTGVKKGWLIGGVEEGEESQRSSDHQPRSQSPSPNKDHPKRLDVNRDGVEKCQVRTFCIEWSGM